MTARRCWASRACWSFRNGRRRRWSSARTCYGANRGTARRGLTRGDALFNLDRYGDAVESYRRAFIRRDLAHDALMRLGQAFSAMGRFDLAIESLDAAVTLRPDSADARLRRAWPRLKFGQYAEGWEDFERRWRSERFVAASRGVVSQSLVPADSRRSGWQAPAPGGRTRDR